MTSKADATFVWIWLPEATNPVMAGHLVQDGERLLFTYGASYRSRKNAIPIYEPELPLQEGVIAPINGLPMASCIRDGSPDDWGRRVIVNRLTGKKTDAAGVPEISELTYLLQSAASCDYIDFRGQLDNARTKRGGRERSSPPRIPPMPLSRSSRDHNRLSMRPDIRQRHC